MEDLNNNQSSEQIDNEPQKNIDILKMEYTSIRDEIILLMNEKHTYTAGLFTLGVSIVGLSYTADVPELFLILYLLLIPFQILINNKEYMLVRCGVYIKIYIEKYIPELQWENIVHDVDRQFNNSYKFSIGKFPIENYIYNYGTFIFSFIGLVLYSSYAVESGNFDILKFYGIIFCIIGNIVDFVLCRKASRFSDIYEKYEKAFIDNKRAGD